MSDERKLFSAGDEFEFKRKFVIAYFAAEYVPPTAVILASSHVQTAYDMADKWWEAIVEHGINDLPVRPESE